MSVYTYTQSQFTSTANVSVTDLQSKIIAASYSSSTFSYILTSNTTSSNTVYYIYFTGALNTSDNNKLNALIAAYTYVALNDTKCFLKDVKPYGTGGGSSQIAWTTRTLNTIIGLQNFCVLSSNRFVLITGTYLIDIKVPNYNSSACKIRLRNITDTNYNTNGTSFTAGGNTLNSTLSTYVTLTYTTTFDVQNIVQTANATIGFGAPGSTFPAGTVSAVVPDRTTAVPASSGTTTDGTMLNEIYTTVDITKLA